MNTTESPTWKFVGERICLDFINTVDARLEETVNRSVVYTFREDKLGGYADLAEWSRDAGLVGEKEKKRLVVIAGRRERESRAVFERAIRLRECLFRIFRDSIDHRQPSAQDLTNLNDECSRARERQSLVYSSGKFEWRLKEDGGELDCLIWPLALSGAELLASEELARVKQCPGPDCGWLFLDTSKNHGRQWCDMKDCGNLAKVRRFRERQNG